MKYLLVGNGPIKDLARASNAADSIVQMNNCRHASPNIAAKTQHIFITNMGAKVSAPLCQAIKTHGALLGKCNRCAGSQSPVLLVQTRLSAGSELDDTL